MISGIVGQGTALPRGALSSSSFFDDFEAIASPLIRGTDSQVIASSSLYTDADGVLAAKLARALVPALVRDDSVIFGSRFKATQSLQPTLYVAVDVLLLPAVALPGILQAHLYLSDDATFVPFISTRGSLRPTTYNAFDTLYAPAVVAAQTLAPNRYTDSDVFYVPTRRTGVGPSRVVSSDVIHAPSVS